MISIAGKGRREGERESERACMHAIQLWRWEGFMKEETSEFFQSAIAV